MTDLHFYSGKLLSPPLDLSPTSTLFVYLEKLLCYEETSRGMMQVQRYDASTGRAKQNMSAGKKLYIDFEFLKNIQIVVIVLDLCRELKLWLRKTAFSIIQQTLFSPR